MVIILDNKDSFVYNLAHAVEKQGQTCLVLRSDRVSIAELQSYPATHLIISPGPCTPNEAGISLALIQYLSTLPNPLPLLGICLGHQALGQAFGANILRAQVPLHGQASPLWIDTTHPLFFDCSLPFWAGRYHSLIVDEPSLPACFSIIARDRDQQIMGIAHKKHPFYGLQFHPESILTPEGEKIIGHFLHLSSEQEHKSAQ